MDFSIFSTKVCEKKGVIIPLLNPKEHFLLEMGTHYTILKNGDVPTKTLISQQQLILEH